MGLRAVLWVCRLAGLAPVSRAPEGKYRRSIHWLVYSIVLHVLLHTCNLWVGFAGRVGSQDVTTTAFTIANDAALVCAPIITLLCLARQPAGLVQVLNSSALGRGFSRKRACADLAFQGAMLAINLWVNVNPIPDTQPTPAPLPGDEDPDYPTFVSFTFLFSANLYMTLELLLITYLLGGFASSYRSLNDKLQAVVDLRARVNGSRDMSGELAYFREQHREMGATLECATDYFGPQLVLEMLVAFIGSVATAFVFIPEMYAVAFNLGAFTDGFWAIWEASIHIPFFIAGHRTAAEGNRAMSILHGYINSPGLSSKEREEASLFCAQLLQNPVRVSMWDIITVDLNLLMTVICSVMTYFIILLQFRGSRPSEVGLKNATG